MDLTVLNEQELQQFVRIVGEDFKIKYETLQQLHAKQAENIELTIKIAKNSPQYSDNDCLQLTELFDASTILSDQCCRRCRISKDELCKLRIIRSCVKQKHKEWLILCPFKNEQFGCAKYLCKSPCIDNDEGWYLRAILELHINYKLGVQIDTAYVCNFSTIGVLNEYRQRLIETLSTYNPSKPFQYIDDAINDIELNASENCIIQCVLKKDHYDYFLFLSNAVISVVISKRASTIEMASKEMNSPKFLSKTGKITRNLHKSSQNSINQQSSNEYKSMEKMKLLHNINLSETHWKKFQQTDLSLKTIESKVPFVNSLSVKMLKKEWNVRSGDMVVLFGTIISDNLDLNISWYIGTKAITNGGRYRYWRKGFDCCLEIFDCDISDSGDIVCIVEAPNCIASDITVLHVNDDDMAGIEPKFLQMLKYDEIYDCLQLICRVSGYPVPYVTFHFRNRRIISNQRISIDRKNDWWILQIKDCTVDDEGKYVAVARNRIGRIFSSCLVILSNKNPATYIADV